LAVLILSVALAGCATNRAAKNLQRYVATQKPRAQAGAVKWSEYYRGLYNQGSAAGLPGDTLGRMNEAIRDAEQYEAGTISESEFNYRQRALNAADKSAQQQRAQQARQNSMAQMVAGAQLMQASGPYTLPQPQPIPQPQQVATPPAVIMGFLQGQSVSGALRYCRYSNGVVSTVSVAAFCPMSTQ
jgi:hypothetical protein